MKKLKRRFRQSLAGFLSFCLTMTSFHMVSWADVGKAFENENATFFINGDDLRESAQAAVDSGKIFHVEDLGLGEEDLSLKKEYEKLFGRGLVYEFMPSYDLDEEAGADGAELRMFVRVPDNQEGYLLKGEEEVIFLYVNESESRITFRSNIDGYLTQKVSVKAFSENASVLPGAGESAGKPDTDTPLGSGVTQEETTTAGEPEENPSETTGSETVGNPGESSGSETGGNSGEPTGSETEGNTSEPSGSEAEGKPSLPSDRETEAVPSESQAVGEQDTEAGNPENVSEGN